MTTFIGTREANRRQADYFCSELQSALREAEAEYSRLSATLAHQADDCLPPGHARRIRSSLRSVDRERRELIRMLMALDRHYPTAPV
jgi:hypothetical protein